MPEQNRKPGTHTRHGEFLGMFDQKLPRNIPKAVSCNRCPATTPPQLAHRVPAPPAFGKPRKETICDACYETWLLEGIDDEQPAENGTRSDQREL